MKSPLSTNKHEFSRREVLSQIVLIFADFWASEGRRDNWGWFVDNLLCFTGTGGIIKDTYLDRANFDQKRN